eukprot:scaffold26736_cov30-Tisochrysis_lutea.AAC.3
MPAGRLLASFGPNDPQVRDARHRFASACAIRSLGAQTTTLPGAQPLLERVTKSLEKRADSSSPVVEAATPGVPASLEAAAAARAERRAREMFDAGTRVGQAAAPTDAAIDGSATQRASEEEEAKRMRALE